MANWANWESLGVGEREERLVAEGADVELCERSQQASGMNWE